MLDSNAKEELWHEMRDDLARYIPEIRDTDKLACCVCGRWLDYDDFTLEHIIPQQSLKDDPDLVKNRVFKNIRSGLTLLCNKPLIFNGRRVHNSGCNSYKGRFHDTRIREVLNRSAVTSSKLNSGYQVALCSLAYLAMVSHYWYYPALLPSGVICRRQFFNPDRFINEIGPEYQMILMGEKPVVYDENDLSMWENPFRFSFERGKCFVVLRGLIVMMPLSRDPSTPISSLLEYVPPKYKLRPDFRAFFS